MRWYGAQCDGAWEHQQGVKIETLDNPGWLLKVSLAGTSLEGRPFAKVEVNPGNPVGDPAAHWHVCDVSEGEFGG